MTVLPNDQTRPTEQLLEETLGEVRDSIERRFGASSEVIMRIIGPIIESELRISPFKDAFDAFEQALLLQLKDSLRTYLRRAERYSFLEQPGSERLFLEALQELGGDALVSVISTKLMSVVTVAQENSDRGVPLDKLIQAGNDGLFKAICRYHTYEITEFSKIADFWIKQTIQQAIISVNK